jgi:hypothetical protein
MGDLAPTDIARVKHTGTLPECLVNQNQLSIVV